MIFRQLNLVFSQQAIHCFKSVKIRTDVRTDVRKEDDQWKLRQRIQAIIRS